MATPEVARVELLDALGPVLCRMGHQRISLSWQEAKGFRSGYYFVDGRDADGQFFSGYGETPSKALAAAAYTTRLAQAGGTLVHA